MPKTIVEDIIYICSNFITI